MSANSQVYSDFKAITQLLTQLNGALITVKRLSLKTSPPPIIAEIDEATKILTRFLSEQRPEQLPRSQQSRVRSLAPADIDQPLRLDRADAERCLRQLRQGLAALDSQSIEFLEGVVKQLGQSSENLYRQMARL